MIVCSGCGNAIEDDLPFCTECGTPNQATRAEASFGQTVDRSRPINFQPPTVASQPHTARDDSYDQPTLVLPASISHGTPPLHYPQAKANRRPLIIVCGVVSGLLLLILGALGTRLLLSDNRSAENRSDNHQAVASPNSVAQTSERSADTAPLQIPHLSGNWILVNTIERTSYPAFMNLRVGYHLTITQTGTEFKAEGEKYLENGLEMNPAQRTPIHVNGSLTSDTISATFVEEGLRRTTTGRFDWRFSRDANELRGTFVSAAAKSSGSSVATRSQ